MIASQPWFSLAIVITLALGIGVNTTVFTLVNAVLYKPLPFPGGERLVTMHTILPERPNNRQGTSYPDFLLYKMAAESDFETLQAYSGERMTISDQGKPPDQYRGARVTTGIFDMIQTRPVIGRGFQASDGRAGAEPVALLSYGVWKDRYGLDPKIAGKTARIAEKPTTIIGVMPEGFQFPNNETLWLPIVPDENWERRTRAPLMIMGILKRGATIAEANAAMSVTARQIAKDYPDTNKDHGIRVETFHQTFNGGPIRVMFLLMMGAVGFVLLIACANVANMLLSRAVGRTREISIRTALGASRWRVMRQLLTESVMLSVMGGVLGLGLTELGTTAFAKAVADVGKPYWIAFEMDWMVFLYFALVCVLSGVLFGFAPAWRASQVNLNEALKDGSRGTSEGPGGGWLSGALVVFQLTLAVVLLTGAGLMMRSFVAHQTDHPEVPADRILTAGVNLPRTRYGKPEEKLQFFEKLEGRLKTLPGVESVVFAMNPPATGAPGWHFEVEGKPAADARRRPATSGQWTSPGYFAMASIPLLQGRDFDLTDGTAGKETAIVDEAFAKAYWPGQNALGKRLKLYRDEARKEPWLTVVGVSRTFRQSNQPGEERSTLVYLPMRYETPGWAGILLRVAGSATAAAPGLRAEVAALDVDLPPTGVESLAENWARQRWYLRVFGTVFLIFAVIALSMACVGIYAVMAYATSRRTREIGVRVAMGASVGEILQLVMGRGVRQLGLGLLLGLVAAFGVCRLMESVLFNTKSTDPLTYAVVAVVLGAVGAMACWIPARRAARLDPVQALRYE